MPFPTSTACADVSIQDGEVVCYPKRKKVAIVGFATNTLHLVPWQDPTFELWGLNQGYMNFHRRPERWFEMHTPEYTADVRDPEYLPWLTKCPVPLYMIQHYDEYPNSVRYPIEEAIRFGGRDYFTSSIAFMLAIAGMEGFEEIHIYGVNLAIGDEYFYEKPCCEWWIGKLEGMGRKLVIPTASSLLKQYMRYGYNPARTPNAMTRTLLQGRADEYQKQLTGKLAEYHLIEGARREAEALKQIAEGLDRGADIVLMGDLSPKQSTSQEATIPYIVRTIGALVTSSNPTGSKNLIPASSFGQASSVGLGHLDDVSNIIIYMTSSGSYLTSSGASGTGIVAKVAMWDFADSTSMAFNENFSTAFYTYSQYTTGGIPVLTSGQAYTISNVAFKALTLNVGQSSGNTDGEIIAWVAKQITV